MIERGTFGSIKEFSVLEYIYEYYDNSNKLEQTHIRKLILDMNYLVSHLKKIENLSFRARTAAMYKNEMKEIITELFVNKDIRDRFHNLCYAKFNNIINDARNEAFKNKNEFRNKQRLESKKQNQLK